jgi:non-ribosomal peptide synthetase component F
VLFRTKISGELTFRELLKRVREAALGAYAHQDLPFELLVEYLKVERNLSYTPLFQVWFVLNNAPMEDLGVKDLQLSVIEVSSGTSKFDIALSIMEGRNNITATLEFDTDIYDVTTAIQILDNYTHLLVKISADPELKIADLSLLRETPFSTELINGVPNEDLNAQFIFE